MGARPPSAQSVWHPSAPRADRRNRHGPQPDHGRPVHGASRPEPPQPHSPFV